MFLRPVTKNDHTAVLSLAKTAGFGMTSLPADADVLREKIDNSVASFSGTYKDKGQENFLFVLEDPETGEIAGTTGIKSHIGLSQPFYSYKITTMTQQSKEISVFSKHELLQVTNDLTGSSEIGSLFLLPEYRRDRLGSLLSLSRFLFIATFPDYFSSQIIAEMRGVNDPSGNSPFYDSIARPFFEMEFHKADYLNATLGNEFINDLMPRYPIYASLLPKAARDVIGQPHPNSVPARAMLEREGFRFHGYIDIFDGGPTLQAETAQLRTVNKSRVVTVSAIDDAIEAPKSMIANLQFENYRCCMARVVMKGDEAVISSKASRLLNVKQGDSVRFMPQETR